MKRNVHTCQICGVEYKACANCDKDHIWRSVVCSDKCWSVYIPVTQRRLGILDDTQAAADLSLAGINANNVEECNIISAVKESVKGIITRAVTEKKTKYQKKKEQEETAETNVTEVEE